MPDDILFEGEYVNCLKKGKGREYIYENYLLFEGKYLNNLRHGKGKEYYFDGKLHFEGEYFYGRRWNIKGYDANKNIISEIKNGKGYIKLCNICYQLRNEGEYLYGLPNGNGKEYNGFNFKLSFEGEFLNHIKIGKGKQYDLDGSFAFEGEFLYDNRIKGKEYCKGKLEFEGEYLYNNKYNGKRYDENGKVIYEWINGNEYDVNGKLTLDFANLGGLYI